MTLVDAGTIVARLGSGPITGLSLGRCWDSRPPSLRGLIMPEHYFWLSDTQFARRPDSLDLLPNKVCGVPRVDDRKVISGIIHVIRSGLIWRDAPACYGPHKTLYNREAGAVPVSSTRSSPLWPPRAPRPGR